MLWSVKRHIGLVVLIGLAVFASSAVLLWSALGFPATAASRLDIIKVALTDESSAQRQVCIDVLCAYVRIPYEPALESEWYLDAEPEVRLAITSVISRHLREDAPVSWQGHDFDLVRTVLRSADFSGVQVPSGKFFLSLVRFPTGWISFDGMVVNGGEVWFGGARFTGGEVDLSEAVISVAPVFDEGEKPGLKLP